MKLSFVGDVCLAGVFKKKVANYGAERKILSDEVLQLFEKSDYTVCNLEGPVTEERCVLSTKLNVKSPKGSIRFLQRNNINVFGLANNHMFDAQHKGFIDTRDELDNNNAPYFGAGDNLNEASKICYLSKDEITVAIIGVGHNVGEVATEATSGIFSYTNLDIIKARVSEAKKNADWVVIFCHAGPEYNFYPTPTVRSRMKDLIAFGADIIIGHHPHVIQGYEYLEENKLIVYSLGNFIFDLESTRSKLGHNVGLIASIKFEKSLFSFETQPTFIDTLEGIVSFGTEEDSKKLKTISDFSNYENKIAKESLRCVFFNPTVPKKINLKTIMSILFYPAFFLYKGYLVRYYDREFVDIIIRHYRLSLLRKFLRNDEFYKYR